MPIIKDYLKQVTLTQSENELGEKVSLELETLGGNYQMGAAFQVSIAGETRDFIATGKSRDLRQEGDLQNWITRLQGTSPLAQAIKKAPKKLQIFLTISLKEFLKFQSDYAWKGDFLDYVPWIRFGDNYGAGGWTASAIAEAISKIIGIPIIWNCPDYDVKELRIEPTQSYLQSVLSLANAYNPMVYYLGGTIFITESIEKAQSPSVLPLSGYPVHHVSEELIRKDKPSQVRLLGNMGIFWREKYKGLTFGTMFGYTFQVGTFTANNAAFGTTTETAIADTGSQPFDFGWLGQGVVDPDTGLVADLAREILTIMTGKNVYGEKGYVLSQTRRINMWRKPPGSSFADIIPFSEMVTVYQYDKTDPIYLRPREFGNIVGQSYDPRPGRVSSLAQYIWQVMGGQVVFANYANLEETRTYYWYKDTGELVSQNTIKTALCYSEDGLPDTDPKKEWKQAKNLKKDDVSTSGQWKQLIVETELLNYQQINKDSYKVERRVSSLGEEGRLRTLPADVQIVQAGAVQGSDENLRKMQVYAESGAAQLGSPADATAIMDVPAQEFSINTPSWAALERMLPSFMARLHAGEITRQYEVWGEWNLYPGLTVSAEIWQNQAGENLESPSLTTLFMVITEFEVRRTGAQSVTRFTARGRLN